MEINVLNCVLICVEINIDRGEKSKSFFVSQKVFRTCRFKWSICLCRWTHQITVRNIRASNLKSRLIFSITSVYCLSMEIKKSTGNWSDQESEEEPALVAYLYWSLRRLLQSQVLTTCRILKSIVKELMRINCWHREKTKEFPGVLANSRWTWTSISRYIVVCSSPIISPFMRGHENRKHLT